MYGVHLGWCNRHRWAPAWNHRPHLCGPHPGGISHYFSARPDCQTWEAAAALVVCCLLPNSQTHCGTRIQPRNPNGSGTLVTTLPARYCACTYLQSCPCHWDIRQNQAKTSAGCKGVGWLVSGPFQSPQKMFARRPEVLQNWAAVFRGNAPALRTCDGRRARVVSRGICLIATPSRKYVKQDELYLPGGHMHAGQNPIRPNPKTEPGRIQVQGCVWAILKGGTQQTRRVTPWHTSLLD